MTGKNSFSGVSTYGLSEHYLTKGPIIIDENSPEFSKGEPVYIEDTQNDPMVKYPEDAKKKIFIPCFQCQS